MDGEWPPPDSIPASELEPCALCGSLEQWQSFTQVWHCMRCDPPLAACAFWAYQKRVAVEQVVTKVRRDAWYAAEHERMLLFPEEMQT
jgi:hypothetical protein